MRHMNCSVVFDKKKESVLFCLRRKDPFEGQLNFVGGKVEEGESSLDAAYRELEEETGIGRDRICLYRFMDITYYQQGFVLEMYVGMLEEDVVLREEKNPLMWLPLTEDFTDRERFAGKQNIAHIINLALEYPIPERGAAADLIDLRSSVEGLHVGIDGCKGGWIAATLNNGKLDVSKYGSVLEIIRALPAAKEYLIDMVIGLPENQKEAEWRPDAAARKELGKRGSTVFSVPCRQAVEIGEGEPINAKIASKQRETNSEVLKKSLSAQTINIIPKIRELDRFLLENEGYRDLFCESHPEVCFGRLNGAVLQTKKKAGDGIEERKKVLQKFVVKEELERVTALAKKYGCAVDDILDAACLAVAAALKAQGVCETIPEEPHADSRGLRMQLTVPRRDLDL